MEFASETNRGITVSVRKYAGIILVAAPALYLYTFWYNLFMLDFL
jgi:hypothetical protein